MWAYTVEGPGLVRRGESAGIGVPLEAGQVRLRFLAGGICGSDMPLLNGIGVNSVGGVHDRAPIHEIVGEVIESRSKVLQIGQRVVGTGGATAGLSELLVESDQAFIPVPDELSDVEAVPIQSIATVIRAANRFPDIVGRRVAVIGTGPIGLAFLHVLRQRGAGRITAIDPVPREAVALRYGADEFIAAHSSRWVAGLDSASKPEIVVEAASQQSDAVRDALRAVANFGFVYGFGGVHDEEHLLPYRELYERGLTLMSGRTLDGWVDVLSAGRDYLLAHRADFADYISHAIPIAEAQRAYSLYARPQLGRLKVALFDEG